MALTFLNQTPMMAYRRLEADLRQINPRIDLRLYARMTPRKLQERINVLGEKIKAYPRNRVYGSWLNDPKFVETKVLHEALETIQQMKEDRESREVLVPGFTYYKATKQFGSNLVGFRCYISEGKKPHWVEFTASVPVAKALEVIRHGRDEDFRRIYVEMADGRLDGLRKIQVEHITKSSKTALKLIEAYCDSRWEGAWPWEMKAPSKLHTKIEERKEMREMLLKEMRGRFNSLLTRLNEGEMDKFEVISQLQEMSNKIQSMIQDLGRIAGEGLLTVKDQARVTMGDQAAAEVEKALTAPVQQAADVLSQLHVTLENAVKSLSGQGGADPAMGGDMGGDASLGTPGDALGGPEELPDQMADVNMDGSDAERPMKDM